jgi:c-di-GMP-binding flagellar brake protein YcgR
MKDQMAKKIKSPKKDKMLTGFDIPGQDAGSPLERRRFIRHSLCFPLTYKMIEKKVAGKEAKSSSVNISMGGLLFLASKPVAIGSTISVKMPFQDKMFSVKAKVIHCDRDLGTKLFNVGVSFYRLSDAFKVKLIEQLYLISEFRDLWSVQLGRDVTLEEASREWIKRYSKRFKRLYW